MTKRALIHVENTDNIIELSRFLASSGWTILSANKTEELLKKNHIPVTREMALSNELAYAQDISRLINDIVSTREEDIVFQRSMIQQERTNNIFLVCINMEPFYYMHEAGFEIKNCDYRISSILRYAFYNHENILVLTDPADYAEALIQLKTDNITKEFRTYVAEKALNLVAAYDAGIAGSLAKTTPLSTSFPRFATYPLKFSGLLKQGTNAHQSAGFYRFPQDNDYPDFVNCHVKDLDFSAVNDIALSWEILNTLYTLLKSQFSVTATNADNYDFTTQFTPLTGKVFTFAVKFGNLIGASIASNILESYSYTHAYDLPHVKNAIFACSAVIDGSAASEIVNGSFTAVIAPDFTDEAKKIFNQNSSIKLIYSTKANQSYFEARFVYGGFLIQQQDRTLFKHWHIKTRNRPSQVKSDELAFGMLLALKTRSYSAILIKQNSIAGIAQGCVSMAKALGEVVYSAWEHGTSCGNTKPFSAAENPIADVLICDEKIYYGEEIQKLILMGVSTIIETGGAAGDEEFIAYCEEHNVSLIFTGMTHITL